MRHGFRQGPAAMKATGRPPSAAASTRSGRPLSGHVPVHAARVSDAASQVQSGSALFSCAIVQTRQREERRPVDRRGVRGRILFLRAGSFRST